MRIEEKEKRKIEGKTREKRGEYNPENKTEGVFNKSWHGSRNKRT